VSEKNRFAGPAYGDAILRSETILDWIGQ